MFHDWLKRHSLFISYYTCMTALPNLSPIAALMGEPTRAAMLVSLLEGCARTASELAACAEVSPQVASNHLAKLLEGQLLSLETQGRHRYYRLASPEVARALEALAAIGRPTKHQVSSKVPRELQFARTCYDHLAGRLGVVIMEGLLEQKYLIEKNSDYGLTLAGEAWFADFGIDVRVFKTSRRSLARRCLDWSERRPHLAGALGAALFLRLQSLGWIAKKKGRAVRLTLAGREGLERELGLKLGSSEVGD
jgi:DNA-binding transcriptional ArsR family regulator